jgi:hypothetical protein
MTKMFQKLNHQELHSPLCHPSLYEALVKLNPYLNLETWLLIEKLVSKFKVCKGDFIFSEGEIVKDFILIDTGQFKVFSKNHSKFLNIHTFFDEFNCLTPIVNKVIYSISPFSLQSLVDGYIYKISQSTFLELCSKNAQVRKLYSIILTKNLNHSSFTPIYLLPISIDDRIEKIQVEIDLLSREALALQKFKEKFPELIKIEPDISLGIICKLAANFLGVSIDSLLSYIKLDKG